VTHRAVVFATHGGPDVLHTIEGAVPHPGPGQVRVCMRAAGVQPFDCAFRRGDLRGFLPATFPQTLGNDFAGVVDAVGDGVTDLAAGDHVVGYCTLTAHAELIVVDADQLVRRPATLPWEVAGGLSASGQTAYNALHDLGVRAGDTLLVHAAAGGVGTIAVQLAREWGVTVIGTASEPNHDYLRSLGTQPVAYGPGLVDRVRDLAPHGVDVALDCIGGQAVPSPSNSSRTGTGSAPSPTTPPSRGTGFAAPAGTGPHRTWPHSSVCIPPAASTCRSRRRSPLPVPPTRTARSRPATSAARSCSSPATAPPSRTNPTIPRISDIKEIPCPAPPSGADRHGNE
jgi:enoyl reductase